jgi:prepilin-type processing-associated H-X9-DG protein
MYESLYKKRMPEIQETSRTVLVYEEIASTCWQNPSRTNAELNDYWVWHGDEIRSTGVDYEYGLDEFRFEANIGFADGHVDYTELIKNRIEAPTYKWNAKR